MRANCIFELQAQAELEAHLRKDWKDSRKPQPQTKPFVYLVYLVKKDVLEFNKVIISHKVLDPEQIKKDMKTRVPNEEFAVQLIDDENIIHYPERIVSASNSTRR